MLSRKKRKKLNKHLAKIEDGCSMFGLGMGVFVGMLADTSWSIFGASGWLIGVGVGKIVAGIVGSKYAIPYAGELEEEMQ